jgi:hypothetical protein
VGLNVGDGVGPEVGELVELDVGDDDGRNVGDTVGEREGNSGRVPPLAHRAGSHMGPHTPPNSFPLI